MILRILFVSFEIKGGTEQMLSSLRENSKEQPPTLKLRRAK